MTAPAKVAAPAPCSCAARTARPRGRKQRRDHGGTHASRCPAVPRPRRSGGSAPQHASHWRGRSGWRHRCSSRPSPRSPRRHPAAAASQAVGSPCVSAASSGGVSSSWSGHSYLKTAEGSVRLSAWCPALAPVGRSVEPKPAWICRDRGGRRSAPGCEQRYVVQLPISETDFLVGWSGRRDSNPRPSPQPAAVPASSGWSRLVLPRAVPSGEPFVQSVWYRPVVERSTTAVGTRRCGARSSRHGPRDVARRADR